MTLENYVRFYSSGTYKIFVENLTTNRSSDIVISVGNAGGSSNTRTESFGVDTNISTPSLYQYIDTTITARDNNGNRTYDYRGTVNIVVEKKNNPYVERSIDFPNLQQINPEIFAWITVPGTPIDYPVALGEDNSYYLNHTVTGESNILGSIFATAGTDFEESHIILYGHNMASGKMFGSLKKYHDKDFRNTYPYVYVYTPETTYTCAIYSVYSTRYDSDVFTLGYKGDSEEWKQWIAETVQNAEYDCNIAPTGKEKVFTLSTCVGDGSSPYRLVIHAVTVAQKEVANAEKEAS